MSTSRSSMSRLKFLRLVIRLILVAYCTALALGLVLSYWKEAQVGRFVPCTGHVVRVAKQVATKTDGYRFRGSMSYSYDIEIRYAVDGREHTARPIWYDDRRAYLEGQRIGVLYDPADPRRIALADESSPSTQARGKQLVVVGCILLFMEGVLSLANHRLAKRGPLS